MLEPNKLESSQSPGVLKVPRAESKKARTGIGGSQTKRSRIVSIGQKQPLYRSTRDTPNRMTPRWFPDRDGVAESYPRARGRRSGFTDSIFVYFVAEWITQHMYLCFQKVFKRTSIFLKPYRGHKMYLSTKIWRFYLINLSFASSTEASASLGHPGISQQKKWNLVLHGIRKFGRQTKGQRIPWRILILGLRGILCKLPHLLISTFRAQFIITLVYIDWSGP